MNKNLKILSLLFVGFAQLGFAQIREEKLILDRKREPEIRKIEKKKTSVETVKNYPPQSKKTEDSLNLRYEITDVPAVSDFKTSIIQGEDISPKFGQDYQNNYVRFGMGNYGKILGDTHIATVLENKTEVGANVHYLSTNGLKKVYDWDSNATSTEISAYLNNYGDNGKFNLTATYGLEDYNYYGIYALKPASDTDLKQRVNEFKAKGFYDFYADNYLDYASVTGEFLSDHFGSRESSLEGRLALKKDIVTLNNGIKISAEANADIQQVNTTFDLLGGGSANHLIFGFDPVVKFGKGENFIAAGINLNYTVLKNSGLLNDNANSFEVAPQLDAQYAASEAVKFYAGVNGGTVLNSYSQLLQENPYLVANQILRPMDTKYHIFFGIKGDLAQNLKYDLSAGYAKKEDIVFYAANGLLDNNYTLNRSAYNFANTFSAVYDNGKVSDIRASVEYFPLQNLSLNAGLNYEKYNLDNHETVLNKPLLKAEIGAKYSMLNEKLLFGFKGIFSTDKTTNSFTITQDPANPLLFSSVEKTNDKVGGFADLNLSAEYRIHKNFSIFALGNNLLNAKYETFKGYKVLGAQILGGVKITF